jgi:2-methylisocitrate lyase-like PEP mutase family enzyme
MSKQATLLRRILTEKTAVAVGAYDVFSSMLIEKAGIDVVYVSGYLTTASFLGQPDLGLMTSTERLMISRQIARRVEAPVIVDIEGGYGNALNVADTVEQFEAAGVAGVQLDDEIAPPKCQSFGSSMDPTGLISIEEMCVKIRAAVDARRVPDFLIMVRSDVLGSVAPGTVPKRELVNQIIERTNAYVQAGADMAFLYAANVDELEIYAKSIDAPLAGLMGYSAPLSLEDYRRYGYKLVISPIPLLPCVARAILQMLGDFRQEGNWDAMARHLMPHDDLKSILRLQEYADLARKYVA